MGMCLTSYNSPSLSTQTSTPFSQKSRILENFTGSLTRVKYLLELDAKVIIRSNAKSSVEIRLSGA